MPPVYTRPAYDDPPTSSMSLASPVTVGRRRLDTLPNQFAPDSVSTEAPLLKQCPAVTMYRVPQPSCTAYPAEQMKPSAVMPAPPQNEGMSSRRFHESFTLLWCTFAWPAACRCSVGAPDRSVSEATRSS